MINLKHLILVLLFASISACAERVHPGAIYQKIYPKDLINNAHRIHPHKIHYEKSGGFMTYDLQIVSRNEQPIYRLNVFYNVDENSAPDTMFFAINNLGYLGRILGTGKDSQYLIEIDYQNNHLTGQLTPKNNSGYSPRKYDKIYEHGFFEPAVINYFITALPLRKGYKASIPTLDLNNGSSVIWANIEVIDREIITIDGKDFETWKVASDGIKQKTIWVSTTEPFAVKMETEGSFGTWKLKISDE